MSQCLCPKREPCPIHKESPLKMPDVVSHHIYVVNVYHVWSEQKWFCTVTKDAIRVNQTERFDTKAEALSAAKL